MSMFGDTFYDFLEGTWDQAKGYLRLHLESLDASLGAQWSQVFGDDNTLNAIAILNPGAAVPSYVANTGPQKKPKWDKVDVASGVKNRLRYINFTAASAPLLLLGRGATAPGDWEEITLGEGVEMGNITELRAPGSWANHFFVMGG